MWRARAQDGTPKLKLGVALCTYNGERFLPAQLESILGQTRRPDVLVACDDASRDGTVGELERWARQAAFPVQIVRNPSNLGYLNNFQQAISKTDADVIVLSDQDDWWLPHKLARIEAAFSADERAAAVFSDAEIVDEALDSLGYGLFDALHVSNLDRQRAKAGNLFPALMRRNFVAGATLAFRTSWRTRILPIADGAVHDEWIALVIAAYGALRFIPERLIKYRHHGANQIGARRRTVAELLWGLRQPRRAENQRMLGVTCQLKERLESIGIPGADTNARSEFEHKIAHLRRRLSLPDTRVARLPVVASELLNGGYARFSSGWRSAVRDLVSPM